MQPQVQSELDAFGADDIRKADVAELYRKDSQFGPVRGFSQFCLGSHFGSKNTSKISIIFEDPVFFWTEVKP